MRKQKLLFQALALSSVLSVCQLSYGAEQTTASSKAPLQDSTPLYLSGIVPAAENGAEGVSIRHDALLSFSDGKLYDTYLLENTSKEDASFMVLLPQLASFASDKEPIASFDAFFLQKPDSYNELLLRPADAEDCDYIFRQSCTPIFSASGLNENTLSLQLLTDSKQDSSLPEAAGVLYSFSRKDTADSTACLSISNLSENCHIYPFGCSYTASEDGYTLSITGGFDSCSVFLTGQENTDFSVSPLAEEVFKMTQETASLDRYLADSCDRYLKEHPEMNTSDPSLLLSDLADYFGKSSVIVSIDLLPTIDWLTSQKRYAVNQYELTVPAGRTVCAQLTRDAGYTADSGAAFLPVLTAASDSLLEITNTVSTMLPEGCSSMMIRGAKNKKLSDANDNSIVSYQIQEYKEGTCSVVLFQTPLWTKTMKYLPVFLVVMAIFMVLCFISYFSRKKR